MEDLQLHESNNPPYDEELKEEIEQRLSILLPVSFIDLLKRWNGGYFPTPRVIKVDGPVPDLLQSYLGVDSGKMVLLAPLMQRNAIAHR